DGVPGDRDAQVRVKRCGKSAPAPGVTRAALQTPPGARPSVGGPARSISQVGRTDGWPPRQGLARGPASQNPAYRPTHRHTTGATAKGCADATGAVLRYRS